MRVRGRRIALLIAGALPLLAEDDRSTAATSVIEDTPDNPQKLQRTTNKQQPQYAQQEEEALALGAAEALHDHQPFSLLPLNLLQIESEFFNETHTEHSLTAGVHGSASFAEAERIDDDEQEDDPEVDGEEKEPPDEKEEELIVTKAGAAVDSEDRETGTDANGIENVEVEEGVTKDNSEASANIVAEAAGNIEEETSLEGADVEKDDLSEEAKAEEAGASQADPEAEAASEDDLDSRKEETNQEGSETETVSGDIVNSRKEDANEGTDDSSVVPSPEGKDEATPSTSDDDIPSTSEKQQPTPEPQVDKIDDEEEGSISNRVAVDYASKSAGALVLEKSPNFKGTSNLLNGDRDRYAISPCEEKKFVVLSLSEDILVKQVKLVNYELYSSRVKDFQIQISQTMGNWVDLGSYTASAASGVQSFDLREPAWGRYLKFKFTSHYGDEFYCTLTQIMVHGSTMVQGFHEHLEELEESSEEEDNQQTEEAAKEDVEIPDAVSEEALDPSSASSDDTSEEKSAKQEETTENDTTSGDGKAIGEEAESDEAAGSAEGAEGSVMESADDEVNSASDDDSVDTEVISHTEVEDDTNETGIEDTGEDKKMSSRKTRNSSTALPAASIDLSSNVFTSMIGRLEPLHLKSLQRLSTMRAPSLPESNQLNTILEKASDSTKAIKKALTDPAILDNLQLWNEANIEEPFPPEAFGSTAIGPREQTLTEKLAAYLEDSEDNRTKTGEEKDKEEVKSNDNSSAPHGSDDNPKQGNAAADTSDSSPESAEEEQPGTKTVNPDEDPFESLHDTDLALATLLDKLPSIECLKKLDFADFKEKALAARRGGHGAHGQAPAGNPAEPIFKMLTDQIKVLQSNLSVHDQFAKEAVQCYQRVLMDVVVELQTMRMNHEARLLKLEQDLQETKTVRWIFVLYQLVMGLPNWVSLLAATFFTSFVSPNAVTKPLEVVQGLLDKYVSEGDHVMLSWTITTCIMILCCVTTISLCHRLLSAVKYFKRRPESIAPKRDLAEDNSCRFTVLANNGQVVSVSTKPVVDSSAAEVDDDFQDSIAGLSLTKEEGEERSGLQSDDEADKEVSVAAERPFEAPGVVADLVVETDRVPTDEATDASPSTELADASDPAAEEKVACEPLVIDERSDKIDSEEVEPPTADHMNESALNGEGFGLLEAPEEDAEESNAPEMYSPKAPISCGALEEAESPELAKEENQGRSSLCEGESRDDSGSRTPDVETEAALETFSDHVTKGPISPSSVARVSDFSQGHCFGSEQEFPRCPDARSEPSNGTTSFEEHSPSFSGPEQKRRGSV